MVSFHRMSLKAYYIAIWIMKSILEIKITRMSLIVKTFLWINYENYYLFILLSQIF